MVNLVSSDASGAANLPVLVQGMQGLFAALLDGNECDPSAQDTESTTECSDHKTEEQETSEPRAKKADPAEMEQVMVPVVIPPPPPLPSEIPSEQNTEMRQDGKDIKRAHALVDGIGPERKPAGTTKEERGIVAPRGAQDISELPVAAVGESGFNGQKTQMVKENAPVTASIKNADPAKTEVKAQGMEVDVAPPDHAFANPGIVRKENGAAAEKEPAKTQRPEAIRAIEPRQVSDLNVTHRNASGETNVMVSTAREPSTNRGASSLPPHSYTASEANAASIRMETVSELRLPLVALNTERLVEHLAGPEMRFTVHLNDSGNVQVVTNIHDRTMQLGMVADCADTASALRSDVPYLEGRMRSQAIELGEVKISLQETATMNSGYSGEHRSRQEWRTPSRLPTGPEPSSSRLIEDDVLYGRYNDVRVVGWMA